MVFDVLQNLKDLASRGTSEGFNINTARFTEASGGSLFGTNEAIQSGESTGQLTGLSRLLENVSSAQFRIPTIEANQTSIGESLKDFSKALNDNIAIRENQRSEDNQAVQGLFESLSSQSQQGGSGILENINSFGADIQEAFTGNRNAIGDFTGSPLFGLSSTALAVGGGILLLFLLKR